MLLRDTTAYCTTFFDYYGLPGNFPGKQLAAAVDGVRAKATCITDALNAEMEKHIGPDVLQRFIPYVQMHEFEGLLFSDPAGLDSGICRTSLTKALTSIRHQFSTPEDINDSPQTAPSKRIVAQFAAYEKPLHGSMAALEIGLDTIRAECPIFAAWLSRLEALQPLS